MIEETTTIITQEVTLNKEVFGVDWAVNYINTDLSEAECYGYTGFDDICSSAVVFKAGKRF